MMNVRLRYDLISMLDLRVDHVTSAFANAIRKGLLILACLRLGVWGAGDVPFFF